MTWCLRFHHRDSFHSFMVLTLLEYKDRMQRPQDMGTHGVHHHLLASQPRVDWAKDFEQWGKTKQVWGSVRTRKVDVTSVNRLCVPEGGNTPIDMDEEIRNNSPISWCLEGCVWEGKIRHGGERERKAKDYTWGTFFPNLPSGHLILLILEQCGSYVLTSMQSKICTEILTPQRFNC